MTDDLTPNDDHRGMARRAGYKIEPLYGHGSYGWYVVYTGPDASRRALRDIGPFDNEADAWARAYTLAQEHRNECV